MHGVTKSITFNAEYNGQSNIAGLTAKTKISRKDFGMAFGLVAEASQVAVSDTVTIEIDLEVIQKAAEAETSTVAQ